MKNEIHSLLSAVWRIDEHAHMFGTLDRKTGHFRSHQVRDLAQAEQLAAELTLDGADVYFAPAAFGPAHNRTAVNVLGAYSFWMDVDCGGEKAESGKGYMDRDKATKAVPDLGAQTGLQPPNAVICSGNGIQVFWTLDSMVPPEQWVPAAQKLKAICASAGFLADPTRTADIASLMRLPGTLNHKTVPAKPAYLMEGPTPPTPKDDFLSALERAHSKFCPVRPAEAIPPVTSASPDTQDAPDPIDVQVIEECLPQLDPDMARASWFRVAAILFHELKGSPIGFTLFDHWSKGGKKYSGLASTRAVWKTMRHDYEKPAKLASLLWMAKQPGTAKNIVPSSGASDQGLGGKW